jgi:hypothetical protein
MLWSCEMIRQDEESENGAPNQLIVAQVGNSMLTKNDILALNVPSKDSATVVSKFVENWIKKELLVKKANEDFNIDLNSIEQKVADYRYALISYEYQKYVIQQKLDTVVTAEEIETYYNEHINNFILRQNILRGRFIKVNKEAQKLRSVKRWIKSDRPQDLRSLEEYAFQFANDYSLEDSTWVKFDELTKNSPFSTITNKIQFLRRNSYVEEQDSLYLYLLKINAYKISEDVSPLDFVKEDIRNVIVNKRKIALVKELENEIFEEARQNEDYQIYR